MAKYLLGIDDAGRGPVIGSMFMAGAMITEEQEKFLRAQNVKDSKMLSHPTRMRLAGVIKENSISYHVVEATPEEIDQFVGSGTNLNTLEAKKMAEIINELNNRKDKILVVVDCPSTNIKAWREKLTSFVEYKENLEIRCEHKADVNHISASAASILAKVAREENVEKIKKELKIDFGSGYPADPITQEFLLKKGKKYLKNHIIRETWQTWKDIGEKEGQSKLF